MKNYTRIALLSLLLCSFSVFATSKNGGRHLNPTTRAVQKAANQNQIQAITPFFFEDFASGLPSGWQAIDNAGNGVNWTYTTTGIANQGSYPGYDSLSTTNTSASNGYMMYDSDSTNGGVGGEDADLITDAIDCSAHSNVHLFFNELLAHYAEIPTVSVSTDGSTWTQVFDASAGLNQNDVTPNPTAIDIDISAIAANQVTVYIKFNFTGDYDYFWMVDDITLYEQEGTDAFLTSITAPTNSCTLLSATEVIEVSIYNNGGTDITQFDITYIADGGAPSLETVTTLIAPGATFSYPFSATADFSLAGAHTIQAFITVLGDTTQTNDTVNASFFTGPHSIPTSPGYSNGFELTDDMSGFATEDLNNDSITWDLSNVLPNTGTYCARISAATAEDYLFTTCFELVDTAEYTLSYFYRATSTSTPTFFEIVLATDQNSSSITQIISPIALISNLAYLPGAAQIDVATTGTYYIGFHAVSGDSLAGLRLDDINITGAAGVGINSIQAGKTVVYPNPSTGFIYLNSTVNSASFNVEVINALGQVVFAKKYGQLSAEMIDLSNQSAGQYVVKVINDKGVNTQVVNITK